MEQIEPKIINATTINGDCEFVSLDDGSYEIRDEHESFILDKDAACKLLICLQNVLSLPKPHYDNQSEKALTFDRPDGDQLNLIAEREDGVMTSFAVGLYGPYTHDGNPGPVRGLVTMSIEEAKALKGLLNSLPELVDPGFAFTSSVEKGRCPYCGQAGARFEQEDDESFAAYVCEDAHIYYVPWKLLEERDSLANLRRLVQAKKNIPDIIA